MIPNSYCAVAAVFAWLALIIVLFIRAIERRNLLRYVDKEGDWQPEKISGAYLIGLWEVFFRPTRKLQYLSETSQSRPKEIRRRYRRFKFLGGLAIGLFAFVILSSMLVRSVCAT